MIGDQPSVDAVALQDSSVPPNNGSFMTDWLGITASIGCAIHCAAMPFVIAFLPMFGLTFLADESFHKVMFVICTLLALVAFVPGWRKHRRVLPAGIALFGLSVIGIAAFAFEDSCCAACESDSIAEHAAGSVCEDENCESCAIDSSDADSANANQLDWLIPFVTPLGGVMLVSAHLVNRQFSRRCGCCSGDSRDANATS